MITLLFVINLAKKPFLVLLMKLDEKWLCMNTMYFNSWSSNPAESNKQFFS